MTAKPDLEVSAKLVETVLGVARRRLPERINRGEFPRPDRRGYGNGKLWKLSTIRAWNPDVADKVVALMNTAETAK